MYTIHRPTQNKVEYATDWEQSPEEIKVLNKLGSLGDRKTQRDVDS